MEELRPILIWRNTSMGSKSDMLKKAFRAAFPYTIPILPVSGFLGLHMESI